jgi:hypothetical protein
VCRVSCVVCVVCCVVRCVLCVWYMCGATLFGEGREVSAISSPLVFLQGVRVGDNKVDHV